MTTLIEKIKTDQVAARKAYDAAKALLLTTLLGEATAVGKNNGNREPTDAEVVAIIKKFIKSMDETIYYLGRTTDAKSEDAKTTVMLEKDILSAYLPKQMTQEETENALVDAISVVGKNMGLVMIYMKANYEGQYDGKLASSIVKKLL
jgi:uncharacterized protein YqeY